jgi:alanine racemase
MVRHSSRIELSHTALKKNVNFLRKRIGVGTVLCSVVKSNAYGHGVAEFVPMAEQCGVSHFAVASAFEAEKVLAHCSPSSTVMIMGIVYGDDLEWAVRNGVELYVFNNDRLPGALAAARAAKRRAIVHLEVETGGNRTGLGEDELPTALSFVNRHKKHIQLKGVCTHLAGAESLNNHFRIERQLRRFAKARAMVRKRKLSPVYHVASSAATLTMPEARMDMVRVGIAQYGFWPSPETYHLYLQEKGVKRENALRRVISWKTDVMDLKQVPKDEFVGYGTAFQAFRDMTVAVIPLGYGNGYPRELSNRGHVLIRGRKAPIVGLVNMNLFMVDVTHIPDVEVGDEVVLIGRQRNASIAVASFSQLTSQPNNETLSRLPTAIPRRVVR